MASSDRPNLIMWLYSTYDMHCLLLRGGYRNHRVPSDIRGTRFAPCVMRPDVLNFMFSFSFNFKMVTHVADDIVLISLPHLLRLPLSN
jgi:hypothetical protein